MAERINDEKRLEMISMITSSYISAFNGPDMRPPDAITIARFIKEIADQIDELYPRPE